ncbi:hypothetical protein [Acaryochloris marina]|uniref:hypothetical protein n=1 Tax=Acaryochloris marina TaxID=155978 RepID=UPI001BB0822A|nr:hypothetical protein [Acaryochloris marina]QUY41295.1 hypothetical protein I1H34_18735 [Acaryochloris marina S15]
MSVEWLAPPMMLRCLGACLLLVKGPGEIGWTGLEMRSHPSILIKKCIFYPNAND